ncbi:MAG: protein kinase [Kofleriaceae bacterium]|nr:protein kinase [Kofleriaceae bacterium]
MRGGTTFGPYRVLGKLGEGGMGEVFLAEHTLLGRRAAIKVLHAERSESRESVERFFNEARATSAVSDPGIVQVFDFGVAPDKTAFIVMEFLEGEQLSHRLHRLGALPPGDALRIVRQVAGSLAAAHAAGIIHRDLKPENLFMVRDAEAPGGERAKILDFGIAKLGGDSPDRFKTRTGAVMGTPVYMSPEQCNDSGKIDHRTDVYSLGCVLFHLLTGRPPFDMEGIGAIISAHLREPAPAPSSVVPHLPPQLDQVVLRCLAKSPDERFPTMFDLHRACDLLLAQISALQAPTVSVPPHLLQPVGPITMPLAQHTTLGTAAGQPSRDLTRSRKNLWFVGAGVAAIGVGVAIAFITAKGGKKLDAPPATVVEPALVEPAPTPVETAPQPVAQPAPVAEPAARAPTVAAQPVVETPTVPVDAGVAMAPPTQKTTKTSKKTTKTSKKSKPAEDLYEDRN